MRPFRLLVLLVVAVALLADAAVVQASALVDRNARNVRLEVNRKGVALVVYRTRSNATMQHILYWGAKNAALDFKHDRSGGAISGRGDWRHFNNFCKPYDGPALFAQVAACKAPDGSYWALQSWPYHMSNFGARSGDFELRLSHWTGPLAVLWAKGDWSWRGRFHHMYGQLTYLGKPVIPFKVSGVGAVLDKRGRNVAVDSLNSDMGRGWRRVNAMLAGRPTGEFCLGFTPKTGFTKKTGRSRVGKYRVSVAGPFVTPDLRVSFSGPGAYNPAVDAIANHVQLSLTQGRRGGSCFPQN